MHKTFTRSSWSIKLVSLLLVLSLTCSLCSCSRSENRFDGSRFEETAHITVMVDSLTDFGSQYSVNTSNTARYIHDKVLNELNIDVTFIESDKLNFENGIAPDITFVTDYNITTTYYRMNGVVNIAPYLEQYPDKLSNLTGLLGEQNVYSCTDDRSEVWYLTQKEYLPDARVTFIRADWLAKLDLEVPQTCEELHNCLIAFRDNAEMLLGEDKDQMIPFFIDNEPNKSAKPLLDSCLDTAADDYEFYLHGYNRVTQKGYKDGLQILNDWYLEDLLPKDFRNIRPDTKEAYGPVEIGYVGAFCAKCDYLYKNGDNSHIKAFIENCGADAKYIAVNTFEDKDGKYNAWDEDYLNEGGNKLFIPSTCNQPLACLLYLNWISDEDNIKSVINCNPAPNSDDPFTSDRYLITYHGLDTMLYDEENAALAIQTAQEVNFIQRGNKCVRYGPSAFEYVVESEYDIKKLYPCSVERFDSLMIGTAEGEFDKVYEEQYDLLKAYGSYTILVVRYDEWNKVMVQGNLKPW